MSVNRYNPYFNPAGVANHPGAFQGQNTIPTASTSARNIEQAVWQWVPDVPEVPGPYRVLMTGLPTENVQKKDIIVSSSVGRCHLPFIFRVSPWKS